MLGLRAYASRQGIRILVGRAYGLRTTNTRKLGWQTAVGAILNKSK